MVKGSLKVLRNIKEEVQEEIQPSRDHVDTASGYIFGHYKRAPLINPKCISFICLG